MRLTTRVIEILQTVKVAGNQTVMPQLERSDYEAVNKTLNLLGGKWNRSAKAHVWDCDPNDPIATAVMTGEVTDWKKEFQFFETPSPVADRIIELADIHVMDHILEPSAGKGAILAAIRRAHNTDNLVIKAVEIQKDIVPSGPWKVFQQDFLTVTLAQFGKFDRIVMNPPFTSGQDIDHVKHAYEMLVPRGRLVAITSPGWTFRNDRKHTMFREWLNDQPGFRVDDLPAGTFKASGTMVATKLLTLHK